jgi:histidyl-tRNA synthetase
MRYENPQRGRLREHWQLNCDIFGAQTPFSEIEIFQLIIFLLNSFGAHHDHFEILVNDKRASEAFLQQTLKLTTKESQPLIKLLDRSKKIKPVDLEKQLATILPDQHKQTLFLQYLSIKSVAQLEHFAKEHQLEPAYQHLITILQMAEKLHIHKYLVFDPSIVRGLDYYTGIVFEVFDKNPENRRAIAGGGSYDRLLEIFGEDPLPAIGFGMGDVTLKDFLQTHQLLSKHISEPSFHLALVNGSQGNSDTYKHDEHSNSTEFIDHRLSMLKLANQLREHHLSVLTQIQHQKFPKAAAWAAKRGAMYLGFLGEQELANHTIVIKNLSTGDQQTFSFDGIKQIVEYIL